MRYDFFIVWGNGLLHLDEIVKIIEERFNVIYEKDIVFSNTRSFIIGLYACDNAPIQHILSKSKYLHNSPKKAYFMLVENHDVREHPTKTGKQCGNIQEVKIKIRNKFNPRWANGKQTLPLDKGVSHDHVIHTSDYESQVDHVLKYLGLPSLQYFRSFSNAVDIRRILRDAPDHVIIKISDCFPNYKQGSDIDIMCRDINKMAQHISGRIKVKSKEKASKLHLDYFVNGKLDLRFDLIPADPGVLESKEKWGRVYVPCMAHELRIRMKEFKKYPHKKHHKKFIDEHTD